MKKIANRRKPNTKMIAGIALLFAVGAVFQIALLATSDIGFSDLVQLNDFGIFVTLWEAHGILALCPPLIAVGGVVIAWFSVRRGV